MSVPSSMVTLPPELETLGEGALRTIREAFIKFDVTNEGYISRSDLLTALHSLGITTTERELRLMLLPAEAVKTTSTRAMSVIATAGPGGSGPARSSSRGSSARPSSNRMSTSRPASDVAATEVLGFPKVLVPPNPAEEAEAAVKAKAKTAIESALALAVTPDAQIDFFAFASLAAKLLTNQTESEQLLRAFAVFDRDRRGTIPVREFRRILSEIGDTPMKPAELLDALIEFADPQGTGQIRYIELAQKLAEEYKKIEDAKLAGLLKATEEVQKGGKKKK